MRVCVFLFGLMWLCLHVLFYKGDIQIYWTLKIRVMGFSNLKASEVYGLCVYTFVTRMKAESLIKTEASISC